MQPFEEPNQYRVGVVGDEPTLRAMLAMFRTPRFAALFADVRLLATASGRSPAEPAGRPREPGTTLGPGTPSPSYPTCPTYQSWRDMVEAHPDLNLLLDLTGDEAVAAELRADLPARIAVVDRRAASFLWETLASDRLCVGCETDLGRARNLLRAVMDKIREDILVLDRDGQVVDVNRNVSERLGKPKEEIVGRQCRELFGQRECDCQAEGHDCPLRRAMATGRSAEARMTGVDERGRLVYSLVSAYPLLDERGRLEQVIEIRRDATRDAYLEKRLQQSEKLAAIGELSTFIAHEIRNPLFAIGGFANALLRSETLDEAAREKTKIILEESRRLDKILKSILNFARPSHAKPGESDVNQVVRETMELLGIGCAKQGVETVLELSEVLAVAKLDAEQLKQCLINLVKNSLEAMPGGGRLTVRTAMASPHVALQVIDDGKGIEPEIMDKLFSPFFSTKDKGSGLGLAMIRKILDESGGDIKIASQVGQGTSVTLLLPPAYAVDGSEVEDHAAGTPPAAS